MLLRTAALLKLNSRLWVFGESLLAILLRGGILPPRLTLRPNDLTCVGAARRSDGECDGRARVARRPGSARVRFHARTALCTRWRQGVAYGREESGRRQRFDSTLLTAQEAERQGPSAEAASGLRWAAHMLEWQAQDSPFKSLI